MAARPRSLEGPTNPTVSAGEPIDRSLASLSLSDQNRFAGGDVGVAVAQVLMAFLAEPADDHVDFTFTCNEWFGHAEAVGGLEKPRGVGLVVENALEPGWEAGDEGVGPDLGIRIEALDADAGAGMGEKEIVRRACRWLRLRHWRQCLREGRGACSSCFATRA